MKRLSVIVLALALACSLAPCAAFAGAAYGGAGSAGSGSPVSVMKSTSQRVDLRKAAVTLSKTSYVYDGKAKKPGVTVKLRGKKVARSRYRVAYSAGCKNVGTYKVTVKGKGAYSGSKSATFAIKPKGVSLSKLTAVANGFTAKWGKAAAQVTGYQLQYDTKANFKAAKSLTVGNVKTTVKTVAGLASGKKYYVRLRTYKVAGGKRHYSGWSKAKAVTTRAAASAPSVKHVTSVSAKAPKASIEVGETVSLAVSVSPADAGNKKVAFASSNAAVASVSDSGVVRGLKAGTATIAVTSLDNAKATASIKMTVVEKAVEPADPGPADPGPADPDPVEPSAGRVYDSNATGAPRAQGRTASTVAALVDGAEKATANRAFGDLVGAAADAVPSVVHVKQFGAYGDGKHDDRDALQAAFDSGASTILFEGNAFYRTNSSLRLGHGDVTVLGNKATIFTDAAYVDGNERLFSVTGKVPSKAARAEVADTWEAHPENFIGNIGIYQLNIETRAYEEGSEPASKWVQGNEAGKLTKLAYTQQFMVQMAHNVDIYGCSLSYDLPAEGKVVDGGTGLDLYTGWHDVTIENCTLRDFCDKESGGGIWIRDLFNMGASNVVFKGNDFRKTCHDEIVAIFSACPWATVGGSDGKEETRLISDVLIAENEFEMTERKASPSVMCFTVKQATGVLIENNKMDMMSSGGLVWAEQSEDVVVRDNTASHTRSKSAGNFLMFRGTISLAEKNKVIVGEADASQHGDSYVFDMDGTVKANDVTWNMSNGSSGYVMNGGTIEGNVITVNEPVHVVFNNSYRVAGNQVVLNAHASDYVQYYNKTFVGDAMICGNEFDNRVQGDAPVVLSVNLSDLAGHLVEFTGNRLGNAGLGGNARMLYYQKPGDGADQGGNIRIYDNDVADLDLYGYYPESLRKALVSAYGGWKAA